MRCARPRPVPSLRRATVRDGRRGRRWGVVALGFVATACLGAALPVRAQGARDAPPAAAATGSGPLETSIVIEMLEVREAADGREIRRWVPVTRLSAGDEVHYTVRVRNPGKEPVGDVVVTKQLPFGVRYQRGSARGPGAEVQFSADGGRTFAPPAPRARESSRAASRGTRRAAAVDPEYTHVRWVLTRPLAPGATALLRFRATFS
jgi:uncharacterized repeat protein (TIGR01451 family)